MLCMVRWMGGVFPMKSILPSTRLARHRKTLIGPEDCSWMAHGWLMENSLSNIDGRGLGWQGGFFNHLPPARHRPYMSLFFLCDFSLLNEVKEQLRSLSRGF